MISAICLKCGMPKAGPLAPCPKCKHTPDDPKDQEAHVHCAEEMSSRKQEIRIRPMEILFDWIVPMLGCGLTVWLLHAAGVRSWWAFLLALPSMLAFQWAVLFVVMGLGAILNRRRPR